MHSLGCLQPSGVNISISPVWLLKENPIQNLVRLIANFLVLSL